MQTRSEFQNPTNDCIYELLLILIVLTMKTDREKHIEILQSEHTNETFRAVELKLFVF